MSAFTTPVLFLIFNRPNTTQQVFEEIRKLRPQYLYIAADGPRSGKPGEAHECELTRQLVLEKIDWKCDIKTLFRTSNQGCAVGVSEAITWFFEHVEEGIILEDDCLPCQGFFSFCANLLEKYRINDQIMHISGNNFQNGIKRGDGSYYLSQFPHIWGWATWRRAWSFYDRSLKDLPQFEEDLNINKLIQDQNQIEFWSNIFRAGYLQTVDTWDYAWFFSVISRNGYAILPNQNLVANIGFGPNATHTIQNNNKLQNLPVFNLSKIIHPLELKVNVAADSYTFYSLFYSRKRTVIERITNKIKLVLDAKKN